MDKEKFTEKMAKWLEQHLEKKYEKTHNIQVIESSSNLDIIPNEYLKKIPNIGLMEFKPDVLGILIDKNNDANIELVFLNRETKKFGLRELGEMLCYCRIANPKHAFMVSLKGLSPAVDKMINHYKNNKIVSYKNNKIIIFRWDETSDKIDEKL
ncbi:MAG: hypothetical protein EA442_01530 [Candidatus Nitrosopelagicus sp.]|nr:MAG: hypothetical protein EA442_01530 [Candidatus Nitrosopelagicus sp.]